MTKKIFVTAPLLPDFEELVEQLSDIYKSKRLTNMGEKHKQLQKELIEYLGVENLDLLVNGHMAIEMSLQSLNLKGEVITSPYTFASTTHAIVRNGLIPVFCDINPNDFTIDVSKIEALITEKTCAILPIHVYGNICNIEEIEKIAQKYNLKVIYDAAHAFGIKYKNIGIGNFGDVSCFSFHATKIYNTIEGGAVCFKDKEFGKRIYDLKNFGIHGPENVEAVGANAKMNEFCAAMGICNLRHVDEKTEKRKNIVERYLNNLSHVKGLQFNPVQNHVKSNYSYFPVIFNEKVFGARRDDVFEELAKNNIYARKYFYPITSAFDCYKDKYDANSTPLALDLSKRVLTLPLYAELSFKDVDKICKIIRNYKT